MTSVFHHHADVAPLLIATPTSADIDALYSATHWSLTDMPALLDSDARSVQAIDALLRSKGYCPVYTDWS